MICVPLECRAAMVLRVAKSVGLTTCAQYRRVPTMSWTCFNSADDSGEVMLISAC